MGELVDKLLQMAEEQEIVADIVAEMRDATMNGEFDDETVSEWADRIEAAHRRERNGNAAAMREALKLCMKDMCLYCKAEARACDLPQCLDGCETLKMAKAALAAKPRNCDIYHSVDEVRMAYHLHGPGLMTAQAIVDWMLATAESEWANV